MKVLVVGGGYAGAACAARLARKARKAGCKVEVTLANPRARFIERIRLHQAASGQTLRERPLDTLIAAAGVRLTLGEVDEIDLVSRVASIAGTPLEWDRLVLALGSRAGRMDVPGAEEHTLQPRPECVSALAAKLRKLPRCATVAIVGGGLTGIETAVEIKEAHPDLHVILLTRGQLLEGWSEAARRHVLATFDRLDVRLYQNIDVRAVERRRLETSQGELDFALCVWTAGFELPSLPWNAGLIVNASGQVRVDPQLRAIGRPQVYAAGDIAQPVLEQGRPMPMGCKSALPSGAHVADNLFRELTGQTPQPFDCAIPYYCVSLGRDDGLVQWSDAQGQLLGRVLTGRRAAWFKELVCRSTWWSVWGEAQGFSAIRWMRTGCGPRTLPPGAEAYSP